ncbi:hypothetical protein SAMN05421847_0912 [Halpernia humi]|uniref:DUF6759 domain-containing protein n=1 Tax=Halpernia humi TaxID=493375 RepID=A0A1H5UT04_9FLAO|nr:DUF6759 domain-containing protein [Halpernia humi]SEF78252.1 hypothetical protein SAMN05421847_0912 [Halpernia humi]
MKKITKTLMILSLVFFSQSFAQKKTDKEKKKYNYVLTTTNINDIEEFLATANHEDPRYPICKRRLVELKNATWMKNGPVTFMQPRPIMQVPKMQQQSFVDQTEFNELKKKNGEKHTTKTVNLLNSLFNPDLKSEEKIILVQNHSNCNIIFSIQGEKAIKLAIPAKGEDFAIVKKGEYHLESNICGISYKSTKNFQKSSILTLEDPVMLGNR